MFVRGRFRGNVGAHGRAPLLQEALYRQNPLAGRALDDPRHGVHDPVVPEGPGGDEDGEEEGEEKEVLDDAALRFERGFGGLGYAARHGEVMPPAGSRGRRPKEGPRQV